jgi:hypothetical protein
MKTTDNNQPTPTKVSPYTDVLVALQDATRDFQEELEPQIITLSVEWRIALTAACTEAFQSGFNKGVAYMENRAPNE